MKYARLDTPDGSHIVRADGLEPQPWDTAGPVLHLLPQLYVDRDIIAGFPSLRLTCTATILHPATRWQMPHELIVRHPLPNRCYAVAGTHDSRWGFLVPLPPNPPEVIVVRVEWRFTDTAQAEAVRGRGQGNAAVVDHLLQLHLRPTERGQVFSMDTAAWPVDDAVTPPPFARQPFAVLSEDGLPNARQGSALVRRDAERRTLLIDERLDVPGILLSDIWGFDEFERERLHEVGQITAFDPASTDTLAHRANACIEMPAKVLVDAVRLARTISYDEGTAYSGCMAACERHPALLALCGWWNANAPDPLHRRAGLCAIELRVREDGEYWNAYYETPNTPVDYPVKTPEIAARIGDVVLIAFHQGQRAATFSGGRGCHLWDVAGNPWQTTGVSEAEVRSGACDEAWYPLAGLASFPDRFPVAWEWLIGVARPEASNPAGR